MSRVLVTGAAGFIGSHVCDRLLADGHAVAGVDNLSTGRRENVPDGVVFIEGDIADWKGKSLTGGAVGEGNDLIIHCAASYDDRNKWHRDTDTNVAGAINVAIAARAAGARVIYFQTALIYGNNPYAGTSAAVGVAESYPGEPFPLGLDTEIAPENSYAISKYAGGQYLRHADIPLLEFRLANIYGPRNLSGPVPTFYKRITEGDPVTIVDSRRDFVYIDDLVDLVVQAIDGDATGTYHVSTGRDYAIGQLYSAVVDALDAHSLPYPETTPRGEDDAPTILLDPSDTQRDFGWTATTDLDEGVERAVDWYREHGVEKTYTHLAVKG